MKDAPRTDRQHRWFRLKCGEYVVTKVDRYIDNWEQGLPCPQHDEQEPIVGAEGPKDLQDLLRF